MTTVTEQIPRHEHVQIACRRAWQGAETDHALLSGAIMCSTKAFSHFSPFFPSGFLYRHRVVEWPW